MKNAGATLAAMLIVTTNSCGYARISRAPPKNKRVLRLADARIAVAKRSTRLRKQQCVIARREHGGATFLRTTRFRFTRGPVAVMNARLVEEALDQLKLLAEILGEADKAQGETWETHQKKWAERLNAIRQKLEQGIFGKVLDRGARSG